MKTMEIIVEYRETRHGAWQTRTIEISDWVGYRALVDCAEHHNEIFSNRHLIEVLEREYLSGIASPNFYLDLPAIEVIDILTDEVFDVLDENYGLKNPTLEQIRTSNLRKIIWNYAE